MSEFQLINGILNHPLLSWEDKKRYIAATQLMSREKQAEFSKLWGNFEKKVRLPVLDPGQKKKMEGLFESIKNRAILKIKSNLPHGRS